jgi:hypothetical protein
VQRTHLFIKVEIEHDPEEHPQPIGEEICRQIRKRHGVRDAELASYTTVED